jgi:hypothetical protein
MSVTGPFFKKKKKKKPKYTRKVKNMVKDTGEKKKERTHSSRGTQFRRLGNYRRLLTRKDDTRLGTHELGRGGNSDAWF